MAFSIENKNFLLDILTELKEQVENGKEGEFNLSLDFKPLNISKSVSIIFDFTDIDFNSKAITNLLTKKFAEFLGLGEQAEPLSNLESIILNLAEDYRIKSGLNIDYDTSVNANNLAKVCSLKVSDDKQALIERLCEYVNLVCDLKPLKLFVLVFGKAFLSKGDIELLYRHCYDKNVRLMLIEAIDKTERLANECRLIIDKDLCTIPQGFDGFIENY
jgi:CRISPR type II-A-associated protein Csn2